MHAPTQPPRPNHGRRLGLAGVVAGVAVAVLVALGWSRSRPDGAVGQVAAAPPAPPPAAVRQLELVHAESFRVQQAYTHRWRAEAPFVDHGWLLVLAGDPAWMVTRQVKEPVLYVGAQTAERINTGQGSGRLVVLVPGDFRLQDAPIFYGSAALPEELRQDQIDAELAAARAAGAVAPAADVVAKVAKPGQTFANDYELRQRAIDLVERYSPGEKDLIAGWRVPLVK